MKLTNFTKQDAINMANLLALITHANKLIDAMKVAGIHMTGNAVAAKEETLAWAKQIAQLMAVEITEAKKAAETKPAKAAPTKTATPKAPKSKKK
jgi:ADP-ribosylglycohydrolase